jgi:hypothetical protein
MKVKVTATLTLETELSPEDYADVAGVDTDDAIIAFELEQMRGEPWDSSLGEALLHEGELSNIKIEKIEEAAQAQSEAA